MELVENKHGTKKVCSHCQNRKLREDLIWSRIHRDVICRDKNLCRKKEATIR